MALRDDLRGLKENVIVGRLIPAGTGLGLSCERRVVSVSAARGGFQFAIMKALRAAEHVRRNPDEYLKEGSIAC